MIFLHVYTDITDMTEPGPALIISTIAFHLRSKEREYSRKWKKFCLKPYEKIIEELRSNLQKRKEIFSQDDIHQFVRKNIEPSIPEKEKKELMTSVIQNLEVFTVYQKAQEIS